MFSAQFSEIGCCFDNSLVCFSFHHAQPGDTREAPLALSLPLPKMMEETSVHTDESCEYDSFDEHNYERPAERWAPLGAAASSPQPGSMCEFR